MEQVQELWKPTSAPQDGMTADQLAVQTDALRRALARHEQIKTDCHHCGHFIADRCELHGRVPVEFQTTAGQCDDWRYDGVPW